MSTLAELQHAFVEYVTAGPGHGPSARLTGFVRGDGAAAAEQRLAVYKNNVYARLCDALAATYPAVARLVGEEFFRFAAQHYVAANPAREPTLLRYGASFPEFLATFAPAASVPYLADVARLEYLYLEAYHAAEAVPLSLAAFDALVGNASATGGRRRRRATADDTALALHPSARLMRSPYPVSRIWELNRSTAAIEGRIAVPGGSESLLIVRPHATVEVRRISRGAFAALGALAAGGTYAAARSAGTAADAETDVAAHLRALAAGDTFVEPIR